MSSTLRIEFADAHQRQQSVTFVSGQKDEWFIGRRNGFTPDINLTWTAEQWVSHRHARIYYEYGAWYIEPLSSNPTLVNEQRLVMGVAAELPANAVITLGNYVLRASYADGEHMPEGHITTTSGRGDDVPNSSRSETYRIEVLARINDSLSRSDAHVLDQLLEVIRTDFKAASSGGIVLYRDKEPYIPASYPRGAAQVSFRLVRRALDTQGVIRWERVTASPDSQNITSLTGVMQAIYAPILRGSKRLGVIYLHTTKQFGENDIAHLAAIAEILGENSQFQPESAELRLPSVFVSYSHADTDFVHKLVADLRRQRLTVWFDERLRGGKDWQDQLTQAIKSSDAFALVMSPDSLASKWVIWEIEKAREFGKRIYPLWHRECDDIPDDLADIQRIDVLADYSRGVLNLVEELYTLSGEEDSLKPEPFAPIVGKGEKVRVLFLAANPSDTDPLRLSEEIRTIQERIRGGKYRDQFDMIQQAWAVRFSDLQQHLLEYRPHIIHFSGHGSSTGELIFEDSAGSSQRVSAKALELLFGALKDEPGGSVRLVVLNACYSAVQAQAIAKEVGCVVGMTRAVGDRAAIEFAGAFYNALTFGKNVQVAFNLACAPMALSDEEKTPKLLCFNQNATDMIFCKENNQ